MPKRSRVSDDRTGGGRAHVGASPPVVRFSEAFAPASDPPSPLSVKELLARAKRKGCADTGTEQAEYVANRIGYQHASLYFHLFEESGTPKEGASLRRVRRAVLFDRKLQSLLLENMGLFDLQFRAQYALALASERGAFAHRDPRNFKNEDHFKDFLRRCSEEFTRQIRNRNASLIASFDLYGNAPVWQAVEIMSFGTLSMLCRNTRSMKARLRSHRRSECRPTSFKAGREPYLRRGTSARTSGASLREASSRDRRRYRGPPATTGTRFISRSYCSGFCATESRHARMRAFSTGFRC